MTDVVDTDAGTAPRPERDDTDKSLRTERKNTDRALEETRTHIENTADDVLERAREHADAVLDTARVKADDKLDFTDAGTQAREVVQRERDGEDAALKDERAAADASLERERGEQARMLAALLPLERAKTDRFLLTERARSDTAVEHRDDFMSIVSHDLRNLLHGVVGTARMLSQQASQSDEGKRTVAATERIERYIARMNRLIGDLVDVASIDAGKLAIYPESADANVLIAEAVGVFAHTAEQKGISLRSEGTETAMPADFDRARMLQVLANLIANAIKFTDRDGVITIRSERDGDEVHVSVRDTGIGIAPQMLDAVFERFWQVGKNDHRGLGLGLYISRCIVDAHGGRIWAESSGGKGSTFHFTFPIRGLA